MSYEIDLPRSKHVDSVLIDGDRATVGINGVTDIVYHAPIGEGDKHFVDIVCGKRVYRCFEISELTWLENT